MTASDLRFAWRSLRRQKLGSALVVGMLALGIGANVAVFSLINGLFLRPFPFPEPERLVYINEAAPRWNLQATGVNYTDFAQWQKDQKLFEALALYDTTTINLAAEEGADRIRGASVTADFPRVVGSNRCSGGRSRLKRIARTAPISSLLVTRSGRSALAAAPTFSARPSA
jgi:putative ABC transport system permease protein